MQHRVVGRVSSTCISHPHQSELLTLGATRFARDCFTTDPKNHSPISTVKGSTPMHLALDPRASQPILLFHKKNPLCCEVNFELMHFHPLSDDGIQLSERKTSQQMRVLALPKSSGRYSEAGEASELRCTIQLTTRWQKFHFWKIAAMLRWNWG